MRIDVTIDSEDATIGDGAGRKAADALRELADTAEVGGIVSGPIRVSGENVGRYRISISRETV